MNHFIHLRVHSAYSLAEGAIKVKDLVKLCVKQGMPAVAVTDSSNMFGAMEFATEAAKSGVQPIIGVQVLYQDENHQLVLLAQNEAGFRNLSRLVSDAYMAGDIDARAVISRDELSKYHEGILCLSGGPKGPVNDALYHKQNEKAEEELLFLKNVFSDRLYVELQRHGWAEEEAIEGALLDLAYKHDVPLVATNDCYFVDRKAHEAHDALLCISAGRYVTEEDRRKVTPEHYFKSAAEMEALFADVPEAIANTSVIAQRCSFLLEPVAPLLPPFDCEGGRSEIEELRAQAKQGLDWRLENFVDPSVDRQPYYERLEFELGIIIDMGFPGYFLICSDFIKWAKEHDIPVGPGRGSGAGSVVAWALKITDLDPLELDLLFERFLNPERVSMPDFDVDFCQERRDEVISYVQEKYGRDKVAQIITFGKLQARNTVRDVGRVLQMPYGQVDRLAKLIPNNPAHPVTLQQALDDDPDLRLEIKKEETSVKLIEIALQLEGLYRHASTHAAGLVIGDRPLHELVPLYRDPRSDMPVTQFNMKFVEQTGLVKFDFLGLKTMTVVHKTLKMVEEQTGQKIDALEIPLDDAPTYELMTRGETVGVFQLESAGMRDVLRKMKPDKFSDIIALVSLYRPGPMDNIPKYIDVKQGREEPDYMHPLLQPFLEETYGIMVYQEQVQRAAQALSGYSLGGADLLRRAMGKKIQAEMDAQRKMFVDGAKEHNDVPNEQAGAIFDNIAKFAGYGFNKSHAAAYALIGYWTAWLKCHYPLQFMAASMTLDLGNTDKLSVFKQDIDRMGMKMLPPDVNRSFADFVVEEEAVRYALAALKGVGEAAMGGVVEERTLNGPYKSIEDFASRINYKLLNKRQFEQLSSAGGFDSLNANRAQMAASAEIVLRYAQSLAEERESGQESLFGGPASGEDTALGLPDLPAVTPWDPLEQLGREFGAVGFYLSAHPLDSRQQQFENLKISSYAAVEAALQELPASRFQMAGVLLKKQEKVSQKGSKYAFLQLSDPTGIFEVTLFSEILHASREYLEAGNSLLLSVEAEQREDQIRFTCSKIEPLEPALEGKIRAVNIRIDDGGPVEAIKAALDEEGSGHSVVNLYVHIDAQRRVQMRLPGRWQLGAAARNTIRAQKGVLEVSEG
ncbi:MAG: DNA polymerase III subunit alpha [Alphaproteobacteria bacterium]|nr:DNA polymerase III subunit alpha [Alphaproteobacteria bacterium]